MSLILSTVLSLSPLAGFQDPQPAAEATSWVTDWAAAKAQAKKEGKDLLVDFTGSDWCIWCKRLKGEVFDEQAFRDAAPKQFVLVELDFPNDKSHQSDELQKQNQGLMAQFAVQGFPTIFLCDDEGRPYQQTGYQEGGADKYLEHLGTLRETRDQRDALYEKAAALTGGDKAKALAAVFDVIPEDLQKFYIGWIDEIIALDADGKADVKAAFEKKKKAIEVAALVSAVEGEMNAAAQKGDWAAAGKVIDEFFAKNADAIDAQVKHQFTFYRAMVAARSEDIELAIKKLEEAKTIVPDHPMNARIDQMIEQMKAQKGGGGK